MTQTPEEPLKGSEPHCKNVFENFLSDVFPNVTHNLKRGDRSPDLDLYLSDDRFGLEMTEMLREYATGEDTVRFRHLIDIHERVIAKAHEILGSDLNGYYRHRLIEPFDNLAKTQDQIVSDLVDVVRKSSSEADFGNRRFRSQVEVKAESRIQEWEISKGKYNVGHIKPQIPDGFSGFDVNLTPDLLEALQACVDRKKATAYNYPKVLVVYDGLLTTNPDKYPAAVRALKNLETFHSIYIVNGHVVHHVFGSPLLENGGASQGCTACRTSEKTCPPFR